MIRIQIKKCGDMLEGPQEALSLVSVATDSFSLISLNGIFNQKFVVLGEIWIKIRFDQDVIGGNFDQSLASTKAH